MIHRGYNAQTANCDEYLYASVCIWTLCRYEHLKRCLESLSENPYAKNTTVYISVDYPPSEKYVEGYKKICDLLSDNTFGFGTLEVIYQKENIGAYRNSDYIIKYGIARNKKLVCIEDDLVFSKNYLEFVNKALDYYADNDQVVGVWGARWSDEYAKHISDLGYNTYLIKWKGCQGEWSETRAYLNKAVNQEFLRDIIYDRKKSLKLRQASKLLFTVCVDGYLKRNRVFYYPNEDTIHCIDYLREIWNIVNDCYFVVPVVPKVYNGGYDGSGEHGGVSVYDKDVELDDADSFELTPCDIYDPDGHILLYEKKLEYDYKKGTYIKACILAACCRLFGEKMAKQVGEFLDIPGKVKRYIKSH